MHVKKLPLTVFLVLAVLVGTLPSAHAAEPLWTYSFPGNEIMGVTVSSDGSAIAVGAGKIWLFSGKGTLLAKESFGDQVVFTPDGLSLVSSYGPTLYHFNRITSSNGSVSPLQKMWEIQLPTTVRSFDISDDGKTIVASVNSAGTYIYASTGKMDGMDERYNALVRVSSTGGQIVGVSQGVLCLYSRTGVCSKSEEEVVGVQPDFLELTSSGTIAVFNDDQRVRSVFLNNKTLQWTKRATGDVTSLAMTPSGSAILVGTENGNINLFDPRGNLSWSYPANPTNKQSAGITSVALSKEGKVAAAGSNDGKIIALNAKGEEIWSNQTTDHIRYIAMSTDGSLVVAAGENTVYTFSSSVKSTPVVRTTIKTSIPVPSQSITAAPGANSSQKMITHEPTSRAITAEPTEYSVIRTSTQSPLTVIVPLGGIIVALLIAMKRR